MPTQRDTGSGHAAQETKMQTCLPELINEASPPSVAAGSEAHDRQREIQGSRYGCPQTPPQRAVVGRMNRARRTYTREAGPYTRAVRYLLPDTSSCQLLAGPQRRGNDSSNSAT